MAPDPARIETVTFDSFSTLVDVDSTAAAVEGYVDDPCRSPRVARSGGNYGMVANYIQVRVADIDDMLAAVVSADETERHKPTREPYDHAADRLGVDLDATVHISNDQVDVFGAMHAGMQGVWIPRQDSPAESFGPEPDSRSIR